MIIKKPMDWINCLHHTLDATECKVDGKTATFDGAGKKVMEILKNAAMNRNTVWWAGNGGSAAICSHLSQDMMNKLGIRSFYNGDSSLLTCMANDFGYEKVYSRPLESLMQENDILIAISSSGNSDNILSCVNLANQKGAITITLSGFESSNKLWNSKSKVSFYLALSLFGIVEVGHEAILHGIIESLWLQMEKS